MRIAVLGKIALPRIVFWSRRNAMLVNACSGIGHIEQVFHHGFIDRHALDVWMVKEKTADGSCPSRHTNVSKNTHDFHTVQKRDAVFQVRGRIATPDLYRFIFGAAWRRN